MSWTSTLWGKLQSLGFFVFVGIVGCGVVLLFVPLLHQRHEMQQEIARLDSELEQQDALEKKQKTEIEALKTDSSFVERTARNKLNLARPSEVIFRFEPPPTPAMPRPR
jgi:cell division protein DivIC